MNIQNSKFKIQNSKFRAARRIHLFMSIQNSKLNIQNSAPPGASTSP
jgi:hypothetical protein